jgi:hypothetical protein
LRPSPWGDCTAQAVRPQSLQGSKGLAESDRTTVTGLHESIFFSPQSGHFSVHQGDIFGAHHLGSVTFLILHEHGIEQSTDRWERTRCGENRTLGHFLFYPHRGDQQRLESLSVLELLDLP